MDAKTYLEEVVAPTILEYTNDVTSVRRGFLACVATFHTVDYLAAPNRPGNLRKQLRDGSPSFALIDEIAHAFKHVVSSKTGLGVQAVISRPPMIWGQAKWDLSRWDDEQGGVTLDDDREIDLLAELNSAHEFLNGRVAASQ